MVSGGLSSLAPDASCAQTLRWKFEKGQQYKVVSKQDSVSTTLYSKRKTSVQSSTQIEMTWEVEAVHQDGSATLAQSIESVQVSVGNPAFPDQAIAVDTSSSDKPERNSKKLWQRLEPMVGMKFLVTVAANGDVKTVSRNNGDAVGENLPLATGGLSDLDLKAALKQAVVSMAGFPERELKPGETWTLTDSQDLWGGTVARSRKFKLKSGQTGNSNIVPIEFQTELKLESLPETEAGSRIESYDQTGTIRFDTGWGGVSAITSDTTVSSQMMYHELPLQTTVRSQQSLSVSPVASSLD